MFETNETSAVWARRILLSLLAVVSLGCVITGGIFYGWIVADWAQSSGSFSGLQILGWILGLMAAALVGVGFVLGGLLFRFMQWQYAPLASLGLTIVSILFNIATYLVFSDTGNGSDSIEVVLLRGACILCLFIVSLPPFLHWLMARPKSVTPEPPRAMK